MCNKNILHNNIYFYNMNKFELVKIDNILQFCDNNSFLNLLSINKKFRNYFQSYANNSYHYKRYKILNENNFSLIKTKIINNIINISETDIINIVHNLFKKNKIVCEIIFNILPKYDNFVISGGFISGLIDIFINGEQQINKYINTDIDIFIIKTVNNEHEKSDFDLLNDLCGFLDNIEALGIKSIIQTQNIINILVDDYKIQIIKSIKQNIQYLFAFFDLSCVRCALYKNKIYTTDDSLNSIKSKIIEVENLCLFSKNKHNIIDIFYNRCSKYINRGYSIFLKNKFFTQCQYYLQYIYI